MKDAGGWCYNGRYLELEEGGAEDYSCVIERVAKKAENMPQNRYTNISDWGSMKTLEDSSLVGARANLVYHRVVVVVVVVAVGVAAERNGPRDWTLTWDVPCPVPVLFPSFRLALLVVRARALGRSTAPCSTVEPSTQNVVRVLAQKCLRGTGWDASHSCWEEHLPISPALSAPCPDLQMVRMDTTLWNDGRYSQKHLDLRIFSQKRTSLHCHQKQYPTLSAQAHDYESHADDS